MPGGYTAAAANFMVFDKEGLVGRGRRGLTEEVMVYARADLPDGMDIASAIEQEIGARCGEIWGRCGRDVGEMWGRCGRDVGRGMRGGRACSACCTALSEASLSRQSDDWPTEAKSGMTCCRSAPGSSQAPTRSRPST